MEQRKWIPLAAALVVVCLLVVLQLMGARPRPDSANEFSAAAAFRILREVIGNEPHPAGSAANRQIRDRIVNRFRAAGYETEVQRSFVCNSNPSCADVENIVAIPPAAKGGLVFLAAHYDSVSDGPGASDDGVGVAVLLQIATMLRAQNGIGFLVTDGEEAGLLGAEAFVRDSGNLGRMRAVVNVENRGTSGPSIMFETSRNNAALVAAAATSIRRPFATSLFPTIYELLPNDTDLTVFKRAGETGINFAGIKGFEYYHTPLDDPAHVDLRLLQHHGDNALAITRALAEKPSLIADQNAVFFDVLGFAVIRWPERWSPWLVIVSLIVLLAGARPVEMKSLFGGMGYFILTVVIALLFGLAALVFPRPVPSPSFAIATMWLAGIAASFVAALPVRRLDARSLFVGCALAWHITALAVALTLPGASYLFAFPSFVMAIGVVARLNETSRVTIAAVAAAIVTFALALLAHTSLGALGLVFTSVILGLVSTTFGTALRVTPRMSAFLVAAFVVSSALLFVLPRPVVETGKLYEIVDGPVQVDGARNGERLNLRIRSQRGADRIAVSFQPAVKVFSVNGVEPGPPNPRRTPQPPFVNVIGPEAVIELESPAPVEVTVSDYSYGREAGARLVRDRRDRGAGDVTRTERKARF